MTHDYAIVENTRNYVTDFEKGTLEEMMAIWKQIESPTFKLVRAGNYPFELNSDLVYPIVEILKVK